MTVAFDAASNVAQFTGNTSWTHTPVGTPRAVVVFTVTTGDDAGQVASVTYGGVGMTQTPNSPVANTLGEFGVVKCFLLGTGIPTGAQTVSITASGALLKRAVAITLTAVADTELVAEQFVNSSSLANPSVVLGLLGRTCFVAEGFFSGQNAVTGITPLTDWTSILEHDFGTQTGGWYRFNTVGSVGVTTGWTQTADDAVMISVAISEVVAAEAKIHQAIYRGREVA